MSQRDLRQKLESVKYKFKNTGYANRLSLLNPLLFRSQEVTPQSLLRDQPRYKQLNIEDPQGILKTSATIVNDKWGGITPSFYGYEDKPINPDLLANQYKVFEGSPQIAEFENVLYFPQYPCLYTINGERIDASCTYRRGNENATQAPYQLKSVPKELQKVTQTFIYGGYIRLDHYGIFLIESITRLWYLHKNLDYPVICHGINQRTSLKTQPIDKFFELLGFDKKRFLHFEKPVVIEKVIVPYPSFSVHQQGFEVHKLMTTNATLRLFSDQGKAKAPKQTAQPLYFSRRLLSKGRRNIINEYQLEQELKSKGVAVYYPEKLSLVQQINLINKHEIIMGTMGSALYNILFNIALDKKMICLTFSHHFYINSLIINALMGIEVAYISSLSPEEKALEENQKYHDTQNQKLDIKLVLNILKEIGV